MYESRRRSSDIRKPREAVQQLYVSLVELPSLPYLWDLIIAAEHQERLDRLEYLRYLRGAREGREYI